MWKAALRISMSRCGCWNRPFDMPNMMPRLSPKTMWRMCQHVHDDASDRVTFTNARISFMWIASLS